MLTSANFDQHYGVQIFALPIVKEMQREVGGEFGGFAGIETSYRDQAADHAGVSQPSPDIFTSADIARQGIFRDGQEDLHVLDSGREMADREHEIRGIFPQQGHAGVRRGGGAANLLKRTRPIGAVESRLPIHHHLRSIDVFEPEGVRILLLPFRVQMSGKAILPAELVPVIDVLAQDNDIGLGHRLGLFKTGE